MSCNHPRQARDQYADEGSFCRICGEPVSPEGSRKLDWWFLTGVVAGLIVGQVLWRWLHA